MDCHCCEGRITSFLIRQIDSNENFSALNTNKKVLIIDERIFRPGLDLRCNGISQVENYRLHVQ